MGIRGRLLLVAGLCLLLLAGGLAASTDVGLAPALLGAVAVLVLLGATSGPVERFLTVPFRRIRKGLRQAGEERLTSLFEGGTGEAARLADVARATARRLEDLRETVAEKEDVESLFEQLEDGVAVVDGDGRVTRANPAFARWAGRSGEEEVLGERVGTLFRNPAVERVANVALRGETGSRELELGERTVLLSSRPYGPGAVLTLRDLTRLRRLEGVRRDFVANVSHELKTPLTSVQGFAEALADQQLDRERVRSFGRRIHDNAVRMRRLVDDLLDLSRIESGAWEPEIRLVDLEKAVRGAWQELRESGAARGSLVLSVDAERAPRVRADPEALRVTLRNLLENAARYSPRAGRITVRSAPAGDRTKVEVEDQGPGVPGAHRTRIFERFYRVDPDRSREAGGTGLGLAIVKHLVAAHGGEVGVESRVGEGATFWFSLPASRDRDKTVTLP